VCTLCEATCGITVTTEGDRITSIRGDERDPFSRGFICPKAYGCKGVHEDPDRLRRPVRRTATGWEEISWDEAFRFAVEGLRGVRERHGVNAVGAYLGNPTAHSYHATLYVRALLRALGSANVYSASSVDQLPKMVSAGLMLGTGGAMAVPDIDRTDYLLVLGANPFVSNGSIMTAPDAPGRIAAIAERGGKVVVIDPRRSETAKAASEHLFIRPGTDAALVLAMIHVVIAEGRVRLGHLEALCKNLDAVREAVHDFTPESVAAHTGIDADSIRRITREFCEAKRAACYGRIGTTCQSFGSIASWAIDVLNAITGNLDREGGVMFPEAAVARLNNPREEVRGGRGVLVGKNPSRVRGLPKWYGEYPVATLADEILTPGAGQIRAMLTVAGNPVSSTPDVDQLDRAFASLDFMVAVDIYINETTRHASVILPPPSLFERDQYDVALYMFAVRNVAKYSPAVFAAPPGQPEEWEILLTLAKAMMGMEAMDVAAVDDFVFSQVAGDEIPEGGGRWKGLTTEEATRSLAGERGPRRMLDLMLRTGPYGDGFGRAPDGLSLAKLEANPHGIDLGPLKPRLPGILRTPDVKIDLAPPLLLSDLPRLRAAIAAGAPPVVLINRRQLRSNNSWMHNVHALVKGPQRCTLLVSEEDAARTSLRTGDRARVTSRAGSVTATVEVSKDMMPGVVSLPHGWGHDREGVQLSIATQHAGVNVNVLSDRAAIDPISGNAAFNGLPVTLEAVR
jgi:anaerobic selenocysteine-containing dehydrogenase